MKLYSNLKLIFFYLIISYSVTARDIVVVKHSPLVKNEVKQDLKNALVKRLGIPLRFIRFNQVESNICQRDGSGIVIGLCIDNEKVKLFYINKLIYKRSIKRIIDQHQTLKG